MLTNLFLTHNKCVKSFISIGLFIDCCCYNYYLIQLLQMNSNNQIMKQQIFQALQNLIYDPKKSTVQFSYLLNKEVNFFQQLLEVIQTDNINLEISETGLIIFNRCLLQALSYKNIQYPKFMLRINQYWETINKLLTSPKIAVLQKRKVIKSLSELLLHINNDQIKKYIRSLKQSTIDNLQSKHIQILALLLEAIQYSKIDKQIKHQIFFSNLFTFCYLLKYQIQDCRRTLLEAQIPQPTFFINKNLSQIQFYYKIIQSQIQFIFQFENQVQFGSCKSIQQQFQGIKQIIYSQIISEVVCNGLHIHTLFKITSQNNTIFLFNQTQKELDLKVKKVKLLSLKIITLICQNLPDNYNLQCCSSPLISEISNLTDTILKQLYNFSITCPNIEKNRIVWQQNTNLMSEMFQLLTQISKFLDLRNLFQNLSQQFIFVVGICGMALSEGFEQQYQQQDQRQFLQKCLKQYNQFDISISIGKWLRKMNKNIDGIQTFCLKICLQLCLQLMNSSIIINSVQILKLNNINESIIFNRSLSSYLNILAKLTIHGPPNQNSYKLIDQLLSKIQLANLTKLQLCCFFMFLKNLVKLLYKNNQQITNNIIRFAYLLKEIKITKIYSFCFFIQNFMIQLCEVLTLDQLLNYYSKEQIQTIFFQFFYQIIFKIETTQNSYLIDVIQLILKHNYVNKLQNTQTILAKIFQTSSKRICLQLKRQNFRNLLITFKLFNLLKFVLQVFDNLQTFQKLQQSCQNNFVIHTQYLLNQISLAYDALDEQQALTILEFVNCFTNFLSLFNKCDTIKKCSVVDLIIQILLITKGSLTKEHYQVFLKIAIFNKGIWFKQDELSFVLNNCRITLQNSEQIQMECCLQFVIYLYFYFIQYKMQLIQWSVVVQCIQRLTTKCCKFQSQVLQTIQIKVFALYLISLPENKTKQKRPKVIYQYIQNCVKSINTQYLVIYLYALNYSKFQIPFELTLNILRILLQELNHTSKPSKVKYPFSNINIYEKASQLWAFLQQKNYWVEGDEYKERMKLVRHKINLFKNNTIINGQPRILVKLKRKKINQIQI